MTIIICPYVFICAYYWEFLSSLCLFLQQEGFSSSTSRLQRLLAESQEMVASLENSTKKSTSPTKSQKNCDAESLVRKNGDNESLSQTSSHTLEHRVSRITAQTSAQDYLQAWINNIFILIAHIVSLKVHNEST